MPGEQFSGSSTTALLYPNPDSRQLENGGFSNIQILVWTGEHRVRNDNEFAANRRQFEEMGTSFFRRGFTNLVFSEDARGDVFQNLPTFNSYATEHRSFRQAYWHVIQGLSDQVAHARTMSFERNTTEKFEKLAQQTGLNTLAAQIMAFNYSIYTSMDGILRKGLPIEMMTEQKSQERVALGKILQSIDTNNPEWHRRFLSSANEVNAENARQIEEVVHDNPSKLRLLVILGSVHKGVTQLLPADLQTVTTSINYDEAHGTSTFEKLWGEMAQRELTDDEIYQVLGYDTTRKKVPTLSGTIVQLPTKR
ncbi:MAG: hypothetical protein RLZZ455_320 [Candidatus Parcubacteria bacterium]|jgi:hypothetical protein